MKSRKIAAAVVIGSVMVSALCGCNKEIVTEPTETESEVTTTGETTETSETEVTAETSATTETSETDEETEASETSEETFAETFGEFSSLYTVYRDYATDLHNASDADLRFGYGRNALTGNNWEYVLFVYDPADGLHALHEADGEMEETEQSYWGYDTENWEPQTFLMSYDHFIDFPCIEDFDFMEGYDSDSYLSPVEDGEYCGQLYAFSGDLQYAYCSLGRAFTVDLTPEQALGLNEGDTVRVEGASYEVTSVFDEEQGVIRYALGDIDAGGYFLHVSVNDEGVAESCSVFDCFGNPAYAPGRLVKMPVAGDCEITADLHRSTSSETVQITGEEFAEYMPQWDARSGSIDHYEDGGYGLWSYLGLNIGENGMPEYVTVSDGQITALRFGC